MMRYRVACGLVMVFSLPFLLFLGPAAPAQERAASSAMEYKAIAFGTDEKENTKKLNDLAAGGWEYVGPLANSMVAFNRVRLTAQEAAAKKELAKWEGYWETDADYKLTIKADRWNSSAPSFGLVSGKLKVIEIREKLTLVDLLIEEGVNKGKTVKMILRLEGDTLHYCGTYNEAHPTEFKSIGENVYYAYKRARN